MKITNLVKPTIFALLTAASASIYADMTADPAAQGNAAAAAAVTDDAITKAVQAKLAAQVPPMDIQVATTDGVVTLSGAVDTQIQADNAVKMAKSVAGVKDVKSSLMIKK